LLLKIGGQPQTVRILIDSYRLLFNLNDKNMIVKIYSDGSSRNNPGISGYGTILVYGDHRKEISEGFKLSTNNRMELLGVISGLESLKKENLNI
jgi:hypothetical protein